jgi:hypothetical protein
VTQYSASRVVREFVTEHRHWYADASLNFIDAVSLFAIHRSFRERPGNRGCLLLARHFTEGFERGAHSFQSAAHQFGLSAEPDADVLWLLEELPGHYAGLELLP